MSRYVLACWLMVLTLGVAQGAIEPFAYRDDAERVRFQALTRELRCPTCQNQDLADSDAPVAADLRREIHRLMRAGESDERILWLLQQRYGDFIRYRPPLEERTFLLWLAPPLLLVAGAGLLVWLSRRRAAPEEERR